MLGRRGPAQAAFTSAELRELGHLDGVDLIVDPADAPSWTRSPRSGWPSRGHVHRAQERRAAARVRRAPRPTGAARRIELRFLTLAGRRSTATASVESIEVQRNRDRARRLRRAARPRRVDDADRDDRVRPGAALRRLPRGAAARRAVRRAQLRAAQRARAAWWTPDPATPCPACTPSAGSSAGRPGSWARTSATPTRPSELPAGGPGLATRRPRRPALDAVDAMLAEKAPAPGDRGGLAGHRRAGA